MKKKRTWIILGIVAIVIAGGIYLATRSASAQASASQLLANAETATIPAIAVTASVMQQDRKQITEAGFDGYIGKPINLKEFLETVRTMIEKSA